MQYTCGCCAAAALLASYSKGVPASKTRKQSKLFRLTIKNLTKKIECYRNYDHF